MSKSKITIHIIISACLIAIAFGSKLALANSWLTDYNPPKNKKETYQRRSSSNGGSRTFCEDPFEGEKLSLVVPKEEIVHQTANSSPNLIVKSNKKSSVPLIFTLVEPQRIEPLVEKEILVPSEGFHRISLPPQIRLKQHKTYSWFIAIPCSNKPHKFREVLKASIQYVPLTLSLERRLRETTNDGEKARIYAAESMWYDAMDLMVD